MIKKITTLLLSAVLLASVFSGCSDDSEIYLACAVSETPRYFDPQVAATTSEKMVAVNIFDGLFKLDENGEPQKCTVKDYKISADGLVYTFTLNSNMKYYISGEVEGFLEDKGKTVEGLVTAEDFAFGITRAVLPETNSQNYSLLSIIKNADKVHSGEASADELGVRVINDLTLEITLEEKSTDFLYALTQPVSYPCDEEFFNITEGRYGLDEEYIISNGAFYLSDIKGDKSVRFSKSDSYSGSFGTTVTSVRLYINTNEIDIAKKVDDGTYNIGFFASEESIDELGRKVVKTDIENITTALVFNMSKDVLKNVKLRTGLFMSIDFASITENNVINLVPSGYKLSGGKVEALTYNIEAARKNMISAFDELNIDNLTVNVLCTEEHQEMVKAIVNNWQSNIGVELNGVVTVVNDEEYTEKLNSGDYDIVVCDLSVDSDKSADFLSIFKSDNSNNIFGYSSEEYDRMVSDLKKNLTEAKSVACESHLLKNAIAVPVGYKNTFLAVAKGTSGVYSAGDSANIYFYKGPKK
ncbi:MAG: peptide ABC transporter substrate-binding protein [Clostridia bacterium]|nr:peptide ABC transporter substrate-binding protein [Clostridia bacterium]